MEEIELSHYPEKLQSCAKTAHLVWKEFLLEKRPHPGRHEQHLLPLDAIRSFTHKEMPPNTIAIFSVALISMQSGAAMTHTFTQSLDVF
jgi:hypothetical protein